MKVQDPKTGEVFEDIEKARTKFCTGKCSKCVLNDHASLLNCREYYSDSPVKAARLMGLEVVEDKEEPMEKKDKPRICEVLGVEVGERFRVESCSDSEFWVEDGALQCEAKSPFHWDQDTANFISVLLDAPEFLIRKPRFTEDEVAKASHLYGAWGANARLRRTNSNTLILEQDDGLWLLPNEWFPSLRPGQCVRLEEVVNA